MAGLENLCSWSDDPQSGATSHATLGFAATVSAAEAEAPLDVERARQLMQKAKAGETLSPEDQAYLNRVRQELQKRNGAAKGGGLGAPTGQTPEIQKLVPLTDLTEPYKGEDGGLYGGGHNDAPPAHRAAYRQESQKIQPLNAEGKPAKDGKIGLITIGFSNTSLESNVFKKTADADPQKSAQVVVVNGAIGSRSAVMWAYDGAAALSSAEQERLDKEMDLVHMPKENRKGSKAGGGKDTWPILEQRLQDAGITDQQVEVLWMKHVEAQPRPLGEFPAHAKALQADMTAILTIAKKRFPNLRIAYLSSRTYAGWTGPNSGSPEPFAYESGFAVRWLIQGQINGDATLNFDPAHGEVKVPLVLWGPYLWANGDKPRAYDGGVWTVQDVRADDHLHPSESGTRKVTEQLLNLFKNDAGARRWFVNPLAPPASAVVKTAAKESKASAPVAADVKATPPENNPGEAIDFERAKRIMQRRQAGETISPEDQAYFERARAEMLRRQGQAKVGNAPTRTTPVADPKMVAALVPLTELKGAYKGEDGGLYGGGYNTPPEPHLSAYVKESEKIRPLDAEGKPSENGKIVLVSIGMSNTTMEFSEFVKTANADSQKSSLVVMVDGAKGARTGVAWALDGLEFLPAGEEERLQKIMADMGRKVKKGFGDTWSTVDERLKNNGVTREQVQALWIKQAEATPGHMGEFPAHAQVLEANLVCILNIAKHYYPNLRVAYLSSRIFAGYATTELNPEPYAYEEAFSMRWVIQRQIKGEPRLNYDPAKGDVKAPLVVWGPYLWANGTTPRQGDGLVWNPEDLVPTDHTHPAQSGRQKVADLLLNFFKTNAAARRWFVKP